MEKAFVCEQCGNKDYRKVGYRNGVPYCRACVKFMGNSVSYKHIENKEIKPKLDYPLSVEQKKLSDKLIKNCENNILTLIYAVCGAGKTEITYGLIADYLSKGKRVGFALPRKDVVQELAQRMKETFPTVSVASVYGGNTKFLVGDIVVCTTHQLYRYPKFFDLLIIDEVDAFPFYGDKELTTFAMNSYREMYVLMSATPSQELINEYSKQGREILRLNKRFHKYPIPVPRVIKCPDKGKLIILSQCLKRYINEQKPVLIFVPTIEESIEYYRFLSIFFKFGNYVNSRSENRKEVIEEFKNGTYNYLITTSVLERGITIENLQVIVMNADCEFIFNKACLIQIVGRAGRKINCPTGEVTFITNKITNSIKETISEVNRCNELL